jgi:hypothetical protein
LNLLPFIYFIIGVFIITQTVKSAIQTFVVPRANTDFITRLIFKSIDKILAFRNRKETDYYKIDARLAFYAPISLLALPPTWLTLLSIGFTFLFKASGIESWRESFVISGSSILTLGFAKGETIFQMIIMFIGATLGLIFVAILISYLPTMYNAYTKRESAVNQLVIRAGTPPSPIEMIARFHRLKMLEDLTLFWQQWEVWFTELEESHTSLSALVFFRSPIPEQSWVNAAETILDGAALTLSLVAIPQKIQSDEQDKTYLFDPSAAITIRAGYIALQRIVDFFEVQYEHEPKFPQDPISISKDLFNEAVLYLEERNIPLQEDLESAWVNYAGWRVNYDKVILALKEITFAPPAPWMDQNKK